MEHDHRLCMSCFRWLKEVERPPERTPDWIIGWQHLTPNAVIGEQSRSEQLFEDVEEIPESEAYGRDRSRFRSASNESDEPTNEGKPPDPADTVVRTGATCRCGTTDHRDAYLRKQWIVHPKDAASRLLLVLGHLADEGGHGKTIDARTLAQTVHETIREDGEPDWALAVGRAIE